MRFNCDSYKNLSTLTRNRTYETRSKDLETPTVVLLEGIFVLYSQKIRDLLNMKVRTTFLMSQLIEYVVVQYSEILTHQSPMYSFLLM